MSMKLRDLHRLAMPVAAAGALNTAIVAQSVPPAAPAAARPSTPAATTPAWEQYSPAFPWQWQPARPLEQAVEDVGPLSTSFRELQTDLRQPLGFSQVYRVPGSEELLMRSSGGLVAVFPQSVYAPTRGGQVPVVPAGTVYHIGLPPALLQGKSTNEPDAVLPLGQAMPIIDRVGTRLERNIESELNLLVEEPDAGSSAVALRRLPLRQSSGPAYATIVNDQNYRAQRIGELLVRAAQAQSSSASSPAPISPLVQDQGSN